MEDERRRRLEADSERVAAGVVAVADAAIGRHLQCFLAIRN
jgi:hypothetical protein